MAYDAFLKIDGITGESIDNQHQGWIEISSFSWGVSQTRVAGNNARVALQNMVVIKRADTASPQLLQSTVSGHTAATATLAIRKAGGGGDFLKYSMSNVLISSLSYQGNRHGDVVPLEQIELKFTAINITVTPTPQ